jgi:uncharacterized protein (TIGR00255 family)
MTAFGRAEAQVGGRKITVELRSVNSRYFECFVKMPRSLGFADDRVKSFLNQNGISRGKVDVSISVERVEPLPIKVGLDRAYAEGYIAALRELRDTYGLADDISTMRVASNRDIFVFAHGEEDEDEAWKDIVQVFEPALEMFLERRKTEGENLKKDLLLKKNELVALVEKVEEKAASYTEAYRQKLETRLKNVLADQKIVLDEARILTECAIFADKTAVDEELVRLRSHFAAYDEIFESDEPVGRKLDFLLQEMNRETNTIGSKCSDAETAATVVEMKCLLEKIREQIQNLE